VFRFSPITLTACALCVALTAGCRDKKAPEDYLTSADRFYQQQELEKARVEYRNALALDPNNAAAHYGLAAIAKEKKDTGAYQFHLGKAVELNPDIATWQYEYGEFSLLAGELEAAGAAERRLRELEPTSARTAQLSLALAVAQNRLNDAKRIASASLKAYPDNAELWGLAAVTAKKQGQWDEALMALEKAIELSDDPLQYRLLRIEVNQERGNLEATINDLSELIASSNSPEAQIIHLSKLLYQRDGHDATVVRLQQYIQEYPTAYALQTLHVDLVKHRDPQAAGQLLDQYIQKASDPTGLLFYRVSAALANNLLPLARQDLQTILDRPRTTEKARHEARALLAEIAWVEQDWSTANTLVDQVLAADANQKSALLLKGRLLQRENRLTEATPYFTKVLSLDRDSIPAMEALAAINQWQGKPDVASGYYQRILERDPNHYEALRFAIGEAFAKGHLANTDLLLSKALQAYPDDTALLSVKLQVAAMLGNFAETDVLLKKMRELNIDAADILFFQGFIKQKQGDHKGAMTLFADAVTKRGEYEKALQAMLASAQASGDMAGLKNFLTRHLKAHPEDKSALLAQVRLTPAAETARLIPDIEKALQANPQWDAGAVALADLYRQHGDEDKAMALLAAHYQENPAWNVGIAYARYLEKSGSVEETEKLYEDLLSNHSSQEVVRNNYALFLLEKIGTTQANRKALQLTEGFTTSNNPALLDTYGSALMRNQNTEKAVFILKKALSLADIPEIKLHYIEALYADGKKTAALELLAELEKWATEKKAEELTGKIAELRKTVK
jgi:tetratricopeptide (TPR) repeat protein